MALRTVSWSMETTGRIWTSLTRTFMTRHAILSFGVQPIVALTDLLADGGEKQVCRSGVDAFTCVVQLQIGRPGAELSPLLK